MADPRNCNLPWPFVAVDENPFMGVEIAPNEIVYVVLGGTYRLLLKAHEELLREHSNLRVAAQAQLEASNEMLAAWEKFAGPQ